MALFYHNTSARHRQSRIQGKVPCEPFSSSVMAHRYCNSLMYFQYGLRTEYSEDANVQFELLGVCDSVQIFPVAVPADWQGRRLSLTTKHYSSLLMGGYWTRPRV